MARMLGGTQPIAVSPMGGRSGPREPQIHPRQGASTSNVTRDRVRGDCNCLHPYLHEIMGHEHLDRPHWLSMWRHPELFVRSRFYSHVCIASADGIQGRVASDDELPGTKKSKH